MCVCFLHSSWHSALPVKQVIKRCKKVMFLKFNWGTVLWGSSCDLKSWTSMWEE